MKNLLIFKEITESGEYIAIGDDGRKYHAAYNAELNTMFFCIPYHVNVLGYLKA